MHREYWTWRWKSSPTTKQAARLGAVGSSEIPHGSIGWTARAGDACEKSCPHGFRRQCAQWPERRELHIRICGKDQAKANYWWKWQCVLADSLSRLMRIVVSTALTVVNNSLQLIPRVSRPTVNNAQLVQQKNFFVLSIFYFCRLCCLFVVASYWNQCSSYAQFNGYC